MRTCPWSLSLASRPGPAHQAHSGSVIQTWVAVERRSPWKSTTRLPGSSGAGGIGSLDAREPCRGFAQGSVDVGVTLRREPGSGPRLLPDRREEGEGDVPGQQPAPPTTWT